MKYVMGVIFVVGAIGATRADTSHRTLKGEWYPLHVGSVWTYNYSGTICTETITGTKQIGGVQCFVMEILYAGQNRPMVEYIGRTRDGYARFGTLYNGQESIYETPQRLLPLTANKGQKWSWKGNWYGTDFEGEYEDQGTEALELDGKKVICRKIYCKSLLNRNQMNYDITTWYAAGIGEVKRQYEYQWAGGNGTKMEMTLKEFSKGGKK